MLPQGTTMNDAATGFKNQGQFLAALHVSKNLGIPFADLKKEMVTNNASLGQAIHKLRPSAHAGTEAEHGETEAGDDLSHSGTGGTTTGGTTGGTTTGGTTGGTTTGSTTGTTSGSTAGTTPTTTTTTSTTTSKSTRKHGHKNDR